MFTDARNCLIMNKLQNGSMEEVVDELNADLNDYLEHKEG